MSVSVDLETSWALERNLTSEWQLLNGTAEFPLSLRYWWSCWPFSPFLVLWRSHVTSTSCPRSGAGRQVAVTTERSMPVQERSVCWPRLFFLRKMCWGFQRVNVDSRVEAGRGDIVSKCWFIHLTRKPRYPVSHWPVMWLLILVSHAHLIANLMLTGVKS